MEISTRFVAGAISSMSPVWIRVCSGSRMVLATWLAGGLLLAAAHWASVERIQPFGLEVAALIWLLPLAVYDLRRREVPHIACVAVPCLGAAIYAGVNEAPQLAGVAILVIAASERRIVQHHLIRTIALAGAILLAFVLALASGHVAPGAIAILGFWLAYELDWWAGADALAAITLALLWPDIMLLVALGIAHLAVAVGVRVGGSWNGIKPKSVVARSVPGLPVIGLAALLHVVLGLS